MTDTNAIPLRPGMTVPLPGPLHSHREKLGELADLGYTDIWSAESDGADAFTPLALAAAWEPRLRLGTAIVPASVLMRCFGSMPERLIFFGSTRLRLLAIQFS